MPNINIDQLGTNILTAMKGKLLGHWNAVEPFVKTEAQKLAICGAQIVEGQANGTITPEQAKILEKMQANSAQAVLTAVETVGMIAAQDAINAGLQVLETAVNGAIGFAFL